MSKSFQPDLLGGPTVPVGMPARRRVRRQADTSMRHAAMVLDALRTHGPAIPDELALQLPLTVREVRRCIGQLRDLGHAVLSGRTRAGLAGTRQREWRAAA